MLSSKLRENICTSFFCFLPKINSCQAKNKFSNLITSSNLWLNLIFITKKPLIHPPPRRNLQNDVPILTKLNETYLLWHEYFNHLPKSIHYTLGIKIDNILTEMIELILTAEYLRGKEKLPLLQQFSHKLDVLKYFITILWQIKALDNNKYANISDKLGHAGRMLGKWLQSFQKETPPNLFRGE